MSYREDNEPCFMIMGIGDIITGRHITSTIVQKRKVVFSTNKYQVTMLTPAKSRDFAHQCNIMRICDMIVVFRTLQINSDLMLVAAHFNKRVIVVDDNITEQQFKKKFSIQATIISEHEYYRTRFDDIIDATAIDYNAALEYLPTKVYFVKTCGKFPVYRLLQGGSIQESSQRNGYSIVPRLGDYFSSSSRHVESYAWEYYTFTKPHYADSLAEVNSSRDIIANITFLSKVKRKFEILANGSKSYDLVIKCHIVGVISEKLKCQKEIMVHITAVERAFQNIERYCDCKELGSFVILVGGLVAFFGKVVHLNVPEMSFSYVPSFCDISIIVINDNN
jgi:hypothetical protein